MMITIVAMNCASISIPMVGATIIANMTGTTPAAWNDPVKGSELTKSQISQGADVVYAAAGGTGVGVLQTAADASGQVSVAGLQMLLRRGKGQFI